MPQLTIGHTPANVSLVRSTPFEHEVRSGLRALLTTACGAKMRTTKEDRNWENCQSRFCLSAEALDESRGGATTHVSTAVHTIVAVVFLRTFLELDR